VRVLEVTATTVRELLDGVSPPWVLVELAYQRGITGTHWLVLSHQSALALAGAATAEGSDLETGHQEAIRDTVNQLALAAGPPLMPLFARSVVYAPVRVHVAADEALLPGDLSPGQRVWVVRAHASGDDVSAHMALTIDEELAGQIGALGAAAPPPAAALERHPGEAAPSKIDLILDVTLQVAVELGRARMQIQDILKLVPGTVIALDKAAGDPVELYINDRPIAKGEVVIIDENFGVRLTSIATAAERIRILR
jgi:flagellar motor switch protein FliN/FliY